MVLSGVRFPRREQDFYFEVAHDTGLVLEIMKGRLIYKEYKTMRGAERYLSRLYNEYDSVNLVDFPKCGESGIYVFKVK